MIIWETGHARGFIFFNRFKFVKAIYEDNLGTIPVRLLCILTIGFRSVSYKGTMVHEGKWPPMMNDHILQQFISFQLFLQKVITGG